MWKIERMMGL